jgi:hypothetical protein
MKKYRFQTERADSVARFVINLAFMAVLALVAHHFEPAAGAVVLLGMGAPLDAARFLLEGHSAGWGPDFAGGAMLPPGSFAGNQWRPSLSARGWAPDFAGGAMLPAGAFSGGAYNPALAAMGYMPPGGNFQAMLAQYQQHAALQAAAAQAPVYTPASAHKKRTWIMGWTTNLPGNSLPAGTSTQMSSVALAPAKVRRLAVADDPTVNQFNISGILSGMDNQSLSGTPIDAAALTPDAVDAHVEFDVVGNGYPVQWTAGSYATGAITPRVNGYCEAIN